ncbi:MAG: CDP-diacylglycerol--glycerol-3-phosphate 3-phosphatidyltransferase [Hyphomicrobiaceae bacterium]
MTDTVGRQSPLNIPNLLTVGRVIAVPLLVAALFFLEGENARWTALAIFVAAAISDFLDGYLARSWQQQSTLGRMLDPIADKLLVGAALLMLVYIGTLKGWSIWAALIIMCREILVSGLREFLASVQVELHVSWLAKWKTTVQMIAFGLLLAGPAGDQILPGVTELGLTMLWLAAMITLWTGYQYLRAALSHALRH